MACAKKYSARNQRRKHTFTDTGLLWQPRKVSQDYKKWLYISLQTKNTTFLGHLPATLRLWTVKSFKLIFELMHKREGFSYGSSKKKFIPPGRIQEFALCLPIYNFSQDWKSCPSINQLKLRDNWGRPSHMASHLVLLTSPSLAWGCHSWAL